MSEQNDASGINPEQMQEQEMEEEFDGEEGINGIDPEQLEAVLANMNEEQRENILQQIQEQGYAEYQGEDGEMQYIGEPGEAQRQFMMQMLAGEQDGDEEEDIELTESQMQQMQELILQQQQMEMMAQEEGEEEENEEQYEEGSEKQQKLEEISQQQQKQQIEDQQAEQQEEEQEQEKTESDISVDDVEAKKKIRRNVYDNINQQRVMKNIDHLLFDYQTSYIAQEYAGYLRDEDHTQSVWNNLLEQHKYLSTIETKLIQVKSRFEEDELITQESTLSAFMEACLLLEESQFEKEIIFSKANNHIGIGLEITDEQIVLVLVFSIKRLFLKEIVEVSQNYVEIRGKMLDDKYGPYAVKIIHGETMKDISTFGIEKIDFDKQKKTFIIEVDIEKPFAVSQKKYIEIYLKSNPEFLTYKKQGRAEKLVLKSLLKELMIQMYPLPDRKLIDIDEDEEKRLKEWKKNIELTRSNQAELDKPTKKSAEEEKAEQERLEREKEEQQQKELEEEKSEESESESDDDFSKGPAEQTKEAISNKEIREELDAAIAEALKQHDELLQENRNLQEKIKIFKNKNEIYIDKTGDIAMNDHKYLNTLAHVNQIRLDLKQTQDRYNKMAIELQMKLEEKQKKCNEIKVAFMELKREVAKKAAYSRTDKGIPEKKIDEWEEKELEKNKIVQNQFNQFIPKLQEQRLENLKLRNQYIKNQKALKKKEELAEGLHLIDFEQLKIENQTLNEKIESRNEDLHKFKKKNTNTVQILTHTKEKLGFIQKQNESRATNGKTFQEDLEHARITLANTKKLRDDQKQKMAVLKQATGIVNTRALLTDYDQKSKSLKLLQEEFQQLKDKKEMMEEVISRFQRVSQNESIKNNSSRKEN